jgi:hypothetical protein
MPNMMAPPSRPAAIPLCPTVDEKGYSGEQAEAARGVDRDQNPMRVVAG